MIQEENKDRKERNDILPKKRKEMIKLQKLKQTSMLLSFSLFFQFTLFIGFSFKFLFFLVLVIQLGKKEDDDAKKEKMKRYYKI